MNMREVCGKEHPDVKCKPGKQLCPLSRRGSQRMSEKKTSISTGSRDERLSESPEGWRSCPLCLIR